VNVDPNGTETCESFRVYFRQSLVQEANFGHLGQRRGTGRNKETSRFMATINKFEEVTDPEHSSSWQDLLPSIKRFREMSPSYPLSMPSPRHHPSSQAASHTSIASFFRTGGTTSPLHRRSPSPELVEKGYSGGDLERGNSLSRKDELDLHADRVSSRSFGTSTWSHKQADSRNFVWVHV
jgi:hypothetical protein